MNLSGKHSIDGNDVFTSFGLVVESGGNDFLRFPKLKEPLSQDWPDQNGKEYDLSSPVFEEKNPVLTVVIIADTIAQFWIYHKAFFTALRQPGTKRFYIAAYERSFYIFYRDNTALTKLVKFNQYGGKIGVRYQLALTEPVPSFWLPFNYLVDKDGNKLITKSNNKILITE
jgi:hypothetical protein